MWWVFVISLLWLVPTSEGICQEGHLQNYSRGEYYPSCINGTNEWNVVQCDDEWCWCVRNDGIEMEDTMTKKGGIPQCARESDEEEAALSAAIVYLIVFLMLLVALIVTIICIICKAKSAHIIRASETLVDDDGVEMEEDRAGQTGDSLTDPPQPFLPPPPTPPIPKSNSTFRPPEIDSLPAPIFPIPPPPR